MNHKKIDNKIKHRIHPIQSTSHEEDTEFSSEKIIKGLATATILSSFAVPTASFAAEKDNSPVEV
ncbi:hypothetical protein, partial [Bacillus sp. 196mf]|uniref:hypothetical protein n=1 Tax=Bacillus sp. 196mf TaxID=1761754 RepID=UPI000D8B38DC